MKIQIEMECANCGVKFLKDKTEITRKKAQGKSHYCSHKCCGQANHKHLEPYYGQGDIAQYAANRKDEFTGLRNFLVRGRGHGHKVEVSAEYLKELWNKQGGKCAYTQIQLVLPDYKKPNSSVYTASLDRIDSGIGYVEGNVQFVSMCVNWMKNKMTDEQTKEMIRLIRQT